MASQSDRHCPGWPIPLMTAVLSERLEKSSAVPRQPGSLKYLAPSS